MLIRISGGIDGIKEYLEHGQKQDRELSRQVLDERVILAGDLEATNLIIQSMHNEAERYLHITLAFKEDELNPELLRAITRDFEAFTFAAYHTDEYSFYAEAHLPKIKSYTNEKTGELVERKPHIHIVIPKTNLMSGTHLNPFGVVEQNTRFIDAVQEHLNNKYGLASPKDNRRIEFTGESEMISRYKGDLFEGSSKQVKSSILQEVLDQNIVRYEDYKMLLAQYGVTRTRNTGRDNEYQNVRAHDQEKGVNLKDYVFSREFIELPHAEKRKRLAADIQLQYETAGPPRQTPEQLENTLQTWRTVRAKEIKYLNSGSRKSWKEYQSASVEDKQRLLSKRESHFYQKYHNRRKLAHGKEKAHQQRHRGIGREYGFKRRRDIDPARRGARGLRNRQRDLGARGQGASSQTLHRLRTLSRVGVVRIAGRGEMLLPHHAPDQLVNAGAESVDALRRDSAGERRRVGAQPVGVPGQYQHDLKEKRQAHDGERLSEFAQIKHHLDAHRLLAELAHSHGVIPDKYPISKGRDGGDRIACGTRHLNVSDFLTKELNLTWKDAAKLLREAYGRQCEQTPGVTPRKTPRQQLWAEYQTYRKTVLKPQQTALWEEQRQKQKQAWESNRKEFYAVRSKIQSAKNLRPADKKAAVSVARMSRLQREAALQESANVDKQQLKIEQNTSRHDQYCEFLKDKAQQGNEQALAELRRMQTTQRDNVKPQVSAVLPEHEKADEEGAPIRKAPALQYRVADNGDVTYQREGRAVLRDEGRAVVMLDETTVTIETGLRLGMMKFGNMLRVNGSVEFREKTALIAAERDVNVTFTDQRLNKIVLERRAEIETEKAREVEARALAQQYAQQREKNKTGPTAQEITAPAGEKNQENNNVKESVEKKDRDEPTQGR